MPAGQTLATLRHQASTHGRYLGAIVVLALAAFASGTYILVQQRLSLPWQKRYSLSAGFAASNGLQPGMGQSVNVAGVKVGTVAGARLRDGRSVVEMEIDPEQLPRVYANARAVLRPNTPLKDMQVDIFPGGPPARVITPDGTIPIARTTPPIDADELLSALDADTRDFFRILVTAGDVGTRGRGGDMRSLLQALGPTSAQARQVAEVLAARRVEVRRLVHNLAVLTDATAKRDRQLAQVIAASDATLGAIASQDRALRESLQLLPGTISAARRTLDNTSAFANTLGPTLTSLMPAVDRLPAALEATGPLLEEAEPVLREDLRPLVREAQPLARDLGPATRDLNEVTPDLIDSFKVLTYVVNELAYNPPGDNEGFLFWLAWFAHNGASVFSTEDANGAVWRGLGVVSCTTLTTDPVLTALVDAVLANIPQCGATLRRGR